MCERCWQNPPAVIAGKVTAFCDFAGPGDESVLAVCEGNRVMLGAPFGSGAIGARELAGICFGGPGGGRALFSAQQVSFEELDPD
jgi:hypothetical protein